MRISTAIITTLLGLSLLAAPGSAFGQQAAPGDAHAGHGHQVRQVAATRFYVAACTSRDYWVRFTTYEAANKAAQAHAKATGHQVKIVKE